MKTIERQPDVEVPRHQVMSGVHATTVLGVAVVASMLVPIGPVAQVVATAGLCVLVGAVLSSFLDLRGASTGHRLVIVAGVGYLGFLAFGAVLGAVLPHLGVSHPLSRGPLLVAWGLVVVATIVLCLRRGTDVVRTVFEGVRTSDVGWAAALAFPPLLALAGAARLNVTGSSVLAVLAAVLVVILCVLAVVLPTRHAGPPRVLLLASAVLTATWQGPLRGGWLAGSDTQHEFYIGSLAIQQAVFPLRHYTDAYGGMLSLTVWPAQLHGLASVNLRATMTLAPGLFLALAIATTWVTLRERLGPRLTAVLCAVFIVGSEPLLRELPQVTRQCYATFLFALLVLAVASIKLPVATRRWIVALAGVGIALTHYSSAYLAAGAVLVGCVLELALRTPRSQRVLTLPVTGLVVGAAVLWGGLVARTGSNLSQVLDSIRSDGFQFLPGSGNVVTKWLHAASVGQLVNASAIRAADIKLRHGSYRWLVVNPLGRRLPLVNDPAPTAQGVHVLGPGLAVAGALIAEAALLAAIVSVVVCLWECRRDRALAGLAGLGLFFLVVASLSRLSQTIGVDFGPSRVQAQAYLLFVVLVGVACQSRPVTRLRRAIATPPRPALVGVGSAILVAVAIAGSTGLLALLQPRGELPAELTSVGEPSQRLLGPADIIAAKWVAQNAPPSMLVQADRFGQLGLDVFGFSDRRNFIPSLDPILIDDRSWIYAYGPNVLFGTARGGDNAQTGVFRFPAAYLASTRSILYVSTSDVVFGSVPTMTTPGADGDG
jgi:hypothetical protein